eukprot:878948-Karenia_brevis.AAC.1
MARHHPATSQSEKDTNKWVEAQIETSTRHHRPQNRQPIKPPLRAPDGPMVTYWMWDTSARENAAVPPDFIAVGQARNKQPFVS